MNRPVLHDYAKSSAAYRVRIALNLKQVDYESRNVDLVAGGQRTEDYRKVNPLGLVPALEIDGAVLTQSLAILVYLDQQFPDPPLMPSDIADGAHVRAMALTVASEIHPINNLRVRHYLEQEMGADKAAVRQWMAHWMEQGLEALEAMAAPRAGAFLFGDQVTLADVCLVPQLYNARRFDVPLDAYPTLVRADANATGLDAFAAAHPDRQEASQ